MGHADKAEGLRKNEKNIAAGWSGYQKYLNAFKILHDIKGSFSVLYV